MWKEPICDRTQQDVDAGRSKGFCNAEDLNRLEDNCGVLGQLLGVKIAPRVREWIAADLPTERELARIAKNIRLIGESYFAYQTTPAPPQSPLTHWQKWNDAEKILLDTHRSYADNRAAHSYSGELSAGERIGLL